MKIGITYICVYVYIYVCMHIYYILRDLYIQFKKLIVANYKPEIILR